MDRGWIMIRQSQIIVTPAHFQLGLWKVVAELQRQFREVKDALAAAVGLPRAYRNTNAQIVKHRRCSFGPFWWALLDPRMTGADGRWNHRNAVLFLAPFAWCIWDFLLPKTTGLVRAFWLTHSDVSGAFFSWRFLTWLCRSTSFGCDVPSSMPWLIMTVRLLKFESAKTIKTKQIQKTSKNKDFLMRSYETPKR